MKKYIILFIFLITYSWASEILDLVQQLISTDSFRENRTLIEKIFANEDRFKDPEGNLDLHEILRKLNTNGILKLFLHKPQSIHISFNSNGNSKFFLKLIFDLLLLLICFKFFKSSLIIFILFSKSKKSSF